MEVLTSSIKAVIGVVYLVAKSCTDLYEEHVDRIEGLKCAYMEHNSNGKVFTINYCNGDQVIQDNAGVFYLMVSSFLNSINIILQRE